VDVAETVRSSDLTARYGAAEFAFAALRPSFESGQPHIPRSGGANHRLYQGSGRDSEIFDHLKTKDEICGPFSYPKAALLLDRIRLTPPSSFNLGCCDLEAHGRIAAGRPPGMLRTWRWRGEVRSVGDDCRERESGGKGPLVPTRVDKQLPLPEKGVYPSCTPAQLRLVRGHSCGATFDRGR